MKEEKRKDYPMILEEIRIIRESQIRLESFLGSELGYGNETEGNVNRRISDIHNMAKNVFESINGNDKPGLKTEVDRIYQSGKTIAWILGASSFLSLILGIFNTWLKH